jgi:ApbE superfamily uncharacterized protein (UPF0280 family)
MSGAIARMLPDGRRLHLQHGPIDIIADADGTAEERALAFRQAATRFETVLEELTLELALLRRPLGTFPPQVRGPVARRMVDAVWPHRTVFVTPMAAVAGAVADDVLDAMIRGRRLGRAYVNNGGDVALNLAPRTSFSTGVVDHADAPAIDDVLSVGSEEGIGGIATSGWRGRSLSRGIADAVTVVARTAAIADAAATLIANAVDCDHPAVVRLQASLLRDDTDLGDLPVTVAVDDLPQQHVLEALARGAATAEGMLRRGLIGRARLALQGRCRHVGAPQPRQSFKAAP